MIFSTETKEIYWILSKLLIHELSILNKIINYKKIDEQQNTIQWYIQNGIQLKKLYIRKKNIFIMLKPKNNIIKLCNLTILLEAFYNYGFILKLNKKNNQYLYPSLREKINTINYYIKYHGLVDIYEKIFNFTSNYLTDTMGNKCIRSIIIIPNNHDIIYEYRTIAISNQNKYINPIERLNTLI